MQLGERLMDSTQKLVEKLVERRMQNTGESQAVATETCWLHSRSSRGTRASEY